LFHGSAQLNPHKFVIIDDEDERRILLRLSDVHKSLLAWKPYPLVDREEGEARYNAFPELID
jgi:hypothetical protein